MDFVTELYQPTPTKHKTKQSTKKAEGVQAIESEGRPAGRRTASLSFIIHGLLGLLPQTLGFSEA